MSEKLDFSKPDQLQTRDGRQVRIYATDGSATYPIHGAIADKQNWILASWRADGLFGDDSLQRPSDLVRKPARVTGWFNVSADGVWYVPHPTLEAAREYGARSTQSCAGQIYIDAEVQS